MIRRNLTMYAWVITTLLTMTTIFISCSKDEDNGNKNIKITDGKSDQTIYADNTESGIGFTTTGPWESIITEGKSRNFSRADSPEWISISPDHGTVAGKYSLDIILGENNTGADRTAIITIICNDTEITITVTQKCTTETGKISDEMRPFVGEWYLCYSAGYERKSDGSYRTWLDMNSGENEKLYLNDDGVAKRKKSNGTETSGTWSYDRGSLCLYFPGEIPMRQPIIRNSGDGSVVSFSAEAHKRSKDYQYRERHNYNRPQVAGPTPAPGLFNGIWFTLERSGNIREFFYENDYAYSDEWKIEKDYKGYYVINDGTFTKVGSDFKQEKGKWHYLSDGAFFVIHDSNKEPQIYSQEYENKWGDVALYSNVQINDYQFSYLFEDHIDAVHTPCDPRALGTPYTIIGEWALVEQEVINKMDDKIFHEEVINYPPNSGELHVSPEGNISMKSIGDYGSVYWNYGYFNRSQTGNLILKFDTTVWNITNISATSLTIESTVINNNFSHYSKNTYHRFK